MDNWYYWPIAESQMFGKVFVYDGTNDGDALMFAGRLMQIALTLLTGIAIFLWLNRFAGAAAGPLGLAMWALNPVSLGYGHLILTDVGVTLMIPVSIWALTVFLRQPSARSALLLGLATGGALAMKFNAILLAPIFLALAAVYLWMQPAPERQLWLGAACKKLPLAAVAIWATLLVVYAPDWKPAPALAAAQATTLNVPSWFQSLRPLLVPRAYFRGLALALGFSAGGHEAFLNGEWRETGWWYYLLEAFTLKTPVPLLLLTGLGMVLLLRQRPRPSFEQVVPWVAAGAYLLLAMHSRINLGVRHLLPMYVLLAVGVADQFSRAARKWRVMAWVLCGWLGLVSLLSYPLYIQYFNEIAGGTNSGYMYLIDSNYDWGQDANRLKHFLDEHGIHHIYLDYFGTQFSIEYLKISNTRVNAEQARQITRGTLVVSASQLMRPEWAWLREQHQPMTRIAYTLFVYQLGGR